MNKMQELRIEKVTLNIGTGQPGEKLEKAISLLNKITGKKPIQRISQKRIPTWNVRPGLAVGTKVTLRGKEAEELLKRLLKAKEDRLFPSNFDNQGNFAFGIPEYIDIEGMEYIVEIGIMGLEASVTLKKQGFRVKERKYHTKRIPKKHRITKEEAIEFVKSKFNIKVEDEEKDDH